MRIDLLNDLLAAEGLGTPGVDLFEFEMGPECRAGVLIKLPLDGVPIDHELPGYFRCQVQVIVRAQRHETGDALSKKVQAALTFNGRDFSAADGTPAMRVNFLRPRTLPIVYPRSDGNGKEWSINLDCSYVLL